MERERERKKESGAERCQEMVMYVHTYIYTIQFMELK